MLDHFPSRPFPVGRFAVEVFVRQPHQHSFQLSSGRLQALEDALRLGLGDPQRVEGLGELHGVLHFVGDVSVEQESHVDLAFSMGGGRKHLIFGDVLKPVLGSLALFSHLLQYLFDCAHLLSSFTVLEST